MRGLTLLALVLMVIGALNWGLVGLFGFNLVTWIFGLSRAGMLVSRIIYVIVGLAGIYGIYMLGKPTTVVEGLGHGHHLAGPA